MPNIIKLDAERCTGCGICAGTCPEFVFESNGPCRPVSVARPELCLGCMACEEDCAVGALRVHRLPEGMHEKDIPEPCMGIDTDKVYDLLIVGAGPAGLGAAIRGRMLGLDLAVLDRLPSPRRSHHPDGGLIASVPDIYMLKETSDGGLRIDELDVNFSPEMVRGRLHNFILMGPDGVATKKERGLPTGFAVVWKDRFVETLAQKAVQLGAIIAWNSRVRKISRLGELSVLTLDGGTEIKARVVISAEGITGSLAHSAGIKVNEKPVGWSFGVAVDMPALENPVDECGFVVGNPDSSPGSPAAMSYWSSGPSWTELMPGTLQKGRHRELDRPLHEYVSDWLEKDSRILARLGCTPEIPGRFSDGCRGFLRRLPENMVGDGIIAVGDSVTTCGMITNLGALKTGDIAAEVAASAIRSGDTGQAALSEFERRFRKLSLRSGMNWMFGPLMDAPMHLPKDKLKELFEMLSHLEMSVVQGGGFAALWELMKFFLRIMPKLMLRPDIRPYLTGGK